MCQGLCHQVESPDQYCCYCGGQDVLTQGMNGRLHAVLYRTVHRIICELKGRGDSLLRRVRLRSAVISSMIQAKADTRH